MDLGDGQSLGLSMDDGNDTVNLALDLDLSAFDVFADGNPFSSEPLAEDVLALFGPDPSSAPQDGYTLETRAESMNILSVGNAVRRGELDTVEIGDAGIADTVSGTETATISGKLREHTGHGMDHVASRMETIVGGRMSITSGFEDGVMLGGSMTDTWAGATMIGAVMSDDLCAGVGVRVTAPIDLWLNSLTGMEERPATVAADGVFVEACGTLFEREYAASVYAVGTTTWTGTTYVTTKTGFRPLMRVAMGVRNLVPGAGAAAEEQAPPAPPAGPGVVGGTLGAGGMVMTGAGMTRATINTALSTDNLIDGLRAGGAAAEVTGAHNAADLRHAADTAAQIEDLRTGAANANQQARNIMLDAWDYSADTLYDAAKRAEADNPARAAVLEEVAIQFDVGKLRVYGGEDPRPGFLEMAAKLERLGYADEAAILKKAAKTYDDFLGAGISIRPAAGLPPQQAGDVEGPYSSAFGEDPYAAVEDIIDPYAVTPLPADPPVSTGNTLGNHQVSEDKYRLTRNWSWQSAEMYTTAKNIEVENPQHADAMRDAASRLDIARIDVSDGKDPRSGLRGAAAQLEALGYTDEAKKLRDAAGEFDAFVLSHLDPYGNLPPGILDYGKAVDSPGIGGEGTYADVGGAGTGETLRPLPSGDDSHQEFDTIADAHDHWISQQSPQALESAKLPEGFDTDAALMHIDEMIDTRLHEFRLESGKRINEEVVKRLDRLAELGDSAADQRRAAELTAEVDALMAMRNAIDDNENMDDVLRRMLNDSIIERGAYDPQTRGYSNILKYEQTLVDELGKTVPQTELDFLFVARSEIEEGRDPRVAMQHLIGTMADGTPATDQARNILGEIDGGTWRRWAGTESFLILPSPGSIPPVSLNPGQADSVGEVGTHRALLPDEPDFGSTPGTGSFGQKGDFSVSAEGLDVPGLRFPDPDIEDTRHLVAIEPEQALAAGEDAAGAAMRQTESGSGAFDSARPDFDPGSGGTGSAAQPQIDEGGARWDVGSETRSPDPDTGEYRAEGSYADVSHHPGTGQDGAAGGGTGTARATPPDTQAVVDAMPDARIADADARAEAMDEPDWQDWFVQVDETAGDSSLDWSQMNDQAYKQYLKYRRDSNWRGTMAFGEALDQMRTDLVQALIDVGGYSDEAAGAIPNASAAYKALAAVVDQAGKTEDWATVQRVGEFLDAFDLRTQDTLTDLANRADEFEGVKNYQGSWTPGSVHDLDHTIDRRKLMDAFTAQQNDAARRMEEAAAAGDMDAVNTISNEVTYHQQMGLALEQGRNPLVESGDQIAYLRSVGKHDQADEYLELHGQLIETLSDPEYHRSAEELGAHAYAPSSAMRPDLSGSSRPTHTITYAPAAADYIDMQSFLRAEVDESGGAAAHGDAGAQATAGNYDAGRDMVNGQVGDADYVRAPAEEPAWVDGSEVKSILRKNDPDATGKRHYIRDSKGAVHEYMDERVRAAGLDYDEDSTRLTQFVPASVGTPPSGQQLGIEWSTPTDVEFPFTANEIFSNALMGTRIDPGDVEQMSSEMVQLGGGWVYPDARRIVDGRYRKQQAVRIAAANDIWNTAPQGMRSWKSPTQRAAKGVRFGDAKIVNYANDVAGIGDTSRAIRHVEAPSSGWVPTRQPGFGRTASTSGDFPFSVRERLLNSLTQGQRIDPQDLAALSTEFVAARTQRYASAASKTDWLKMAMLLRDLQMTHLSTAAQAPSFARSLDGKTLGKLLDLFESAATLA